MNRKKITKDFPVKKNSMEILFKMNPDQNWKTERKTDLDKINRKKITKDFPVKKKYGNSF